MGYLTGGLYCFLWYTSILAGYAGLFCPILPFLFVSNRLYRYLTDVLFTFWQYYPTVLLEVLCKCEVQISGDPILSGETSLMVMNHRTRTDWNFLWPAAYHCVVGPRRHSHPIKFVLKDMIRHIPGPGWVMQLACCVYIKRRWRHDRATFENAVTYFGDMGYKYTLMVFPEGTDLTASTKTNSDRYAEKNNLEKYEHVLHPRTTGFAYLTSQLMARNDLDAVYNVTLVYPDLVPQSEKSLLKGEFPKHVKIHLARYPAAVLPKTAAGLRAFLEEAWREKERVLREYVATGNFLHGEVLRRAGGGWLRGALVFWTALPAVVAWLFVSRWWFRWMVVAHSVLLVAVNFGGGGFLGFESGVFAARRWVRGR